MFKLVNALKHMKNKNIYNSLIQHEVKYFILFSILAILTPVLSIIIPWVPENETAHTWFQRSGSAMVVFGLLAESRAVNCFFILNPSGFAECGINEANEKFKKYPKSLNIISFIFIAFGTLIWGYGDIPFKNT